MESCPSCSCFSDEPHHKDCPRLLSILGFNPPSSRYTGHWCKKPPRNRQPAEGLIGDPLRRVPSEIASQILLRAVEDPRDDVVDNGHLHYQVYTRPLELAAVCKYWRYIAFSEPQLWTTLDLRGGSASNWVQPLELLEEWLQRSGQLPLTIFLVVPLYVDYGVDNRFMSCVKTLCAYSSRWQNLMLNIPLCTIPLFQYDPSKTPFLTYLHLDTSRAPSEQNPGSSVITALRPTHLVFVGERPLLLPISWDNIISLKLDGRNVAQLLDILRSCPKIEYMHVTLQTWADENYLPVSHGPLALAYLQTMILEFGDQLPFEDLLSQLTTPNLTKLSAQGLFFEVPVSVASVTALCMRSQNTCLQSLAFHCCVILERELLELLETSPSLRYLTLHDNSSSQATITDRFFGRLLDTNPASDQFIFLPKLCSIDYAGATTFSWRLVADAAEARLNLPHGRNHSPPRPLEYFAIDANNLYPDEELMDEDSLLRFLALAKGLSRQDVYLHFNPRAMEGSLIHHRMPAPDHDVGLYYSLPHCLAMYGLS